LSTAAPVRGFVFDAYGTLFDVHSIVSVGREVTADPQALSATWRQKQLEYTWLRALMGRYEDFWTVTEAALRYAIRRLALTASEAQIHRLMDAYLSLACFPEVKAALGALAPQPRAILSNGSPRMLEAAVASSGLGIHLDHVLSVDAVKTYKPSPQVYALGPQALGVAAEELLFVSSNSWDVAGATAFGYQVAWCNRTQAPEEELGVQADVMISRLDQLPQFVARDAAKDRGVLPKSAAHREELRLTAGSALHARSEILARFGEQKAAKRRSLSERVKGVPKPLDF